MNHRDPPLPIRLVAVLVVTAVVAAVALTRSGGELRTERQRGADRQVGADRSTAPDPTLGDDLAGAHAVLRAEAHRESDVILHVRAPVVRVLRDDRDGSPHQRFVLEVADSVTVLVAHNLELALRVPLSVGDTVSVRGEYEWNPQGGVLHWTHDDPDGRHPGGWVELDGRRYD